MLTGVIRPRCTLVPLDSVRVPIPILDNPTQASGTQALGGLGFYFVEEAAGFPPTTPAFGQVVLEARKSGAYLQGVPNELLADSPAFTEVFLPQTIAKGLDWHIDDYCIYTGPGTGEPQSLINAPAAVTVSRNTGGQVLFADLPRFRGVAVFTAILAGRWRDKATLSCVPSQSLGVAVRHPPAS